MAFSNLRKLSSSAEDGLDGPSQVAPVPMALRPAILKWEETSIWWVLCTLWSHFMVNNRSHGYIKIIPLLCTHHKSHFMYTLKSSSDFYGCTLKRTFSPWDLVGQFLPVNLCALRCCGGHWFPCSDIGDFRRPQKSPSQHSQTIRPVVNPVLETTIKCLPTMIGPVMDLW